MGITLSALFADNVMKHTGVTAADQLGGGSLVVYGNTAGGSVPTGANEALTGSNVACATFTLAVSASQSDTGGILTLAFTSTTVTAGSSQTASFFRALNSSGSSLIQGTVGTSGADFNLTNVAINSGDNVAITGTPTITNPVT